MTKHLITVALAGVATVVAACGGGRPSDDVTPVAPVASGDEATSLEQEFVRIVRAVSPSVVQIRTPQDLGSGVVFDARGEPPPRLRRHLLRHHALDAGSVMAALLAVPAVRRFLEQIIGAPLRPADLERLCAVAFLHDFGKLDPDFQALDRLLPDGRPAPVPGPRPRHDLIAALVVAELRRPAAMCRAGRANAPADSRLVSPARGRG